MIKLTKKIMNIIKYLGVILILILFSYFIYITTYSPLYSYNLNGNIDLTDISVINTTLTKKDAYLINLDSRKDRLEIVTNHFKNHLNLIRTSAVYITDDIKNKKYPNTKLTNGQIGCGLSHINIVKYALKTNLPTVLILEDDCKPTEYFSNWFPIKNWLDSNLDKWDVFIGGNCKYYWHSNTKKDTIKPICSLNNDIKLYYTKIMCFQFLYINSRAYNKFIKWGGNNIDKHGSDDGIDNWPDKLNMLTISCTPFIAIQEIGESDIKGASTGPGTFEYTEKMISSVENNEKCYSSLGT